MEEELSPSSQRNRSDDTPLCDQSKKLEKCLGGGGEGG